eukprot:12417096-Karenia_brevis.AAC.1
MAAEATMTQAINQAAAQASSTPSGFAPPNTAALRIVWTPLRPCCLHSCWCHPHFHEGGVYRDILALPAPTKNCLDPPQDSFTPPQDSFTPPQD